MTITLTANDEKGAREAVLALAAAGYHGKVEGDGPEFPATEKVPAGRVVDGVAGHTVKPRAATFEVPGEFMAEELVEALNEAGFHPAVLD